MGYYYCFPTYEKAVQELIDGHLEDDGKVLLTAKTNFGKHLWIVSRHPEENNGKSFITLYLLDKYKGFWGYKCITEKMGPYYYAPMKILQAVDPTTNKQASKFRTRSVIHHMKRRRQYGLNDGPLNKQIKKHVVFDNEVEV